LKTLAGRNSVDSFYRGDIAGVLAEGFRRNGGLVTKDDLAAYRAREVQPLSLEWNGQQIVTAPLTAGGATVLQVLRTLKALDWPRRWEGPERLHARLEAMRLAWKDRLTLFGDPKHVDVPLNRILSEDFARESAERVSRAVRDRKSVAGLDAAREHGGTIHLSAADAKGNLASLTLTHGGSFGAQVTAPGLGLTLGHGLSRFEPRPGHPNSIGPRKRPLHNMCPTLVLRDHRAFAALGGRGGRRIPNALIDVLARLVGEGLSMRESLAAPRVHTEGDQKVRLEKAWPETDRQRLESLGYQLTPGNSATVDAVVRDAGSGALVTGSR
jgi:gamma-glutamyltranspeptidase/glutathione hydrolase